MSCHDCSGARAVPDDMQGDYRACPGCLIEATSGDAALIDTTLCEGIRVYQLRTDALHALSDRIATMISNAERVAEHRPC